MRKGLNVQAAAEQGSSSSCDITHLAISTTAFVVNMLPASAPPRAPQKKPDTKGEPYFQ